MLPTIASSTSSSFPIEPPMVDHSDVTDDVELLRSKPDQLILKYAGIVRLIVRKYVVFGMFQPSEYDDIVQSVLESLLKKIPAMQRQYNGSALFVTYFSSIVRNICLAIQDATTRSVQTSELREIATSDPEPIHDVRLIEETLHRFRTILTLYDMKLPKVLLSLKLHFRIPITANDLLTWYPECSKSDRASLLRSFGGYYEEMRDPEVFRLLTPILNKLENKSNQPDSIRRFVGTTIREIIALLNGHPPRHTFDKESLSALVENYFFPDLRKR